ncbi:MAG: hypothetical protein R3C01_04565 [Planctomycetaceae bacterium]
MRIKLAVMGLMMVGLLAVDTTEAEACFGIGRCRPRPCRVRCRTVVRVRGCWVSDCCVSYLPTCGYDTGCSSGCGDMSYDSGCGGCGTSAGVGEWSSDSSSTLYHDHDHDANHSHGESSPGVAPVPTPSVKPPVPGADESPAEAPAATSRGLRRGVQYVVFQGPLDAATLTTTATRLMQDSVMGRIDQPAVMQMYFEAIVARRAGMNDVAAEKLAAAITAESTHPVRNWGSLLERFQGADRRWIEEARYSAK